MTAAAPAWSPACMDAEDLGGWEQHNGRLVGRARSTSPCADCLPSFSYEMRPLGRCNGIPRGAREEEEPMDLPQSYASTTRTSTPPRRVALDVTAPPCGSCAHEPVCALRAAFEGVASVEVEVGALSVPSGSRLELVATVSCDHFLRDRAKPAPARVLTSQERGQANGAAAYRKTSTADWTPERRAAQGERMRLRNAVKVEAAAG